MGGIEVKALTVKNVQWREKQENRNQLRADSTKDVIRIWDMFYIDTPTILNLL